MSASLFRAGLSERPRGTFMNAGTIRRSRGTPHRAWPDRPRPQTPLTRTRRPRRLAGAGLQACLSILDGLPVFAQDQILGRMREAQVRQPPGMNLGPGPEAGVDPPVTEQKRLQMLALLAQVLHGRFPSPHQIANGFVSRVGNPNGRQLAGAMQSGQRERIPTIG